MMKLTRASSYALQAVAYMAAQHKENHTASHIIAEDRKIPERFLLKVLKPLVSAQVLFSVKGPNGGYRLARPANEISVLEILEAVEGPIRGHAPGDGPTNSVVRKLEVLCDEAAEMTRNHLNTMKVSELAA
ncbi:MAG: Rrf2 family transcriptional regulator [Gemmataceae bacterium]|nr:Rrf2 family transcriptional regulator [Gemmataceae bacterium]